MWLTVAVLGAGCTDELPTALPQPIVLAENGDAITTLSSVNHGVERVTLIDSGSPVTAFDDGTGKLTATAGDLQIYGFGGPSDIATAADALTVERAQFYDVRLYTTPLTTVGLGSGFPIAAVLGGDNLQKFAVSLDYRGPTTMRFLENLFPCSCELADTCEAVFPFSLAGGGQDRPIAIGQDVYTYPASRILIDVCLEPIEDPVSRDQPCTGQDPRCTGPLSGNNPACPPAAAYMPSGVDVKVMVATGFPGFALGKGAYERLRGTGSYATALASPVVLHQPSSTAAGTTVGQAVLGSRATSLAALAMVSREAYFGPCAELARSRRARRSPPQMPRDGEAACVLRNACGNLTSPPDACSDSSQDAGTAAIIELEGPLPALVLDDDSGILSDVNLDVRPQNVTVEGIIGTDVLSKLLTTIDYPGGRLAARCASDDGCLTYPRFTPNASGCDDNSLCQSAAVIPTLSRRGGACLAADTVLQSLPLIPYDMGSYQQVDQSAASDDL